MGQRPKVIKHLEDNMGASIYDLGFDKDFLDLKLKAWARRKRTLIKITVFVLQRTPQSEKLHRLEDVIANSVFEKRFVHRIFEELIQVKKKKVACDSVKKKVNAQNLYQGTCQHRWKKISQNFPQINNNRQSVAAEGGKTTGFCFCCLFVFRYRTTILSGHTCLNIQTWETLIGLRITKIKKKALMNSRRDYWGDIEEFWRKGVKIMQMYSCMKSSN